MNEHREHEEVPLAMRMVMWARVQPYTDCDSLKDQCRGDEVAEFTMWAMDLDHVPTLQEIMAKFGTARRTAIRRRAQFLQALAMREPPQWNREAVSP